MNNLKSNEFSALLSQNSESPHWKLIFCSNEGKEIYKIPVGVIVYFVMNRVNRIKEDGQIDFSKYKDILNTNINYQEYRKDGWIKYYNELFELIERKSEIQPAEKIKAYNMYSQFAYFLFNNYDFSEWVDFAETSDNSTRISNPNYEFGEKIRWCGNSCDENGNPYISYFVNGFEYLFILDLWELLYNPNSKIQAKKCKYCGDFFFSMTKQRKYCYDCTEPKQFNKIRNEEQKKDEAKSIAKKIYDVIYNRYGSSRCMSFLSENQYHKDRLKDKMVEINPDYPDIKTKEEYLQWLRDYHKRLIGG